VLAAADEPRILSPFVLAELDYFIQQYVGIENELLFLDEVAKGVYDLAAFDNDDIATARDVVAQYRSLGVGLADASIVVLAERYGTHDILTLDERHFRAMRPLTGRRSFRLLPADA
jgi:predicted nucleic acid-binding protein